MQQTYYIDHVTKITEPFYVCHCPAGHAFWSVTYQRRCRECGRVLDGCLPADTKKAASGN